MTTRADGRPASEARWPATVAVVLSAILYLRLPGKYTVGPSWLVPALELLAIAPLYALAPRRLEHESTFTRVLSYIPIGIANVANIVSLGLLIHELVYDAKNVTAPQLLFSSIAIWTTNVIVFALWFWELDSGGPYDRLRDYAGTLPDFLFPQRGLSDPRVAAWRPTFLDYLYLAFTNATAFSPTDTLPLSPLAKTLMLVQSAVALATVAIVASRAVNIIS